MEMVCRKFLGYPSKRIIQELERRKRNENVYFTASDGEIITYNYKELENEQVPLNVLQFRGAPNKSVQQPYQSNKHLSSDITGYNFINTLSGVDDVNGHILSVGNESFFYTNIKYVNLRNVEYIGDSSFIGSGITSISLPKVQHILNNAFKNNTPLKSVNLLEQTVPPVLGNNVFSNDNNLTAIWVKNETYKSYLTADNWKDIKNLISSVTQPLVTFLCGDIIVKEEKLNYGMSSVAPIVSRPYYDFKGWDNDYNDVSTDITCNAIFSKRFLNDDTTVLEMENHYVTGTSADFIHTCDEINPNVSCTIDGVTRLLNNTEDYDLSYENNSVNWRNLNVGDLCSQVAQVIVTGKGYYEGQVSTDFTITYFRNGSDKVTVTFDPCGGDVPSEPQDIIYNIGDTYGLCSEFNVLDTTASRVGYDFLGWFDEGSESRVLSTDTIMKSTPYTLSARWQTRKISLSVTTGSNGWGKVNGKTISKDEPLICSDIEYGTVIGLSAEGNYGYHFSYWKKPEETLSAIDVRIVRDTSQTVHFTVNEHNLNLVSVPTQGGTIYGPDKILFKTHTNISAFTNDGYNFTEWKTNNDMTISKQSSYLSAVKLYLNEDTDATISAFFTPKTYIVTLNKDGGTCTELNSYTYGTGATLPTDWTKEGYVFEGWYDNSELTGSAVTEITTTDIGNKEYWVKASLRKMSVTYHTNYEKPITGTDWTKVNEWLPTLEVGDTSISCPTCSGFMPITLQVIDKDTISCAGYDHTVTFQFNNVLTNKDGSAYIMAFNFDDATQPNRYGHDLIYSEGCSFIKYFLGGQLASGQETIWNFFHYYDDGTFKSGEDLVQTEAFLNAIQTPTLSVAYYEGTVLQGQETFNDKFWLPSYTQLGGIGSSSCEVEDKCLSYFKDESGNPIGESANDKRVRKTVGAIEYGENFFLRTASKYGRERVFYNRVDGMMIDDASSEYLLAVCPCLTLAYND